MENNGSRLRKNKEYLENIQWTINQSRQEIDNGLELLKNLNQKCVSFFGSARTTPDEKYYYHARDTAFELSKQGYAIITGGGPGIMHASNSGAMDANGTSVGFKASLLKEQERNDDAVFTHKLGFHFLFSRRFCLAINSEALIFYPGGYGTLNEFFEYMVLMQVHMSDAVPIICVNKKFWKGLFKWIKKKPMKQELLNKFEETPFLHVVDDVSEIMDLVKKA